MAFHVGLSRDEVAQTIVTIATALVAARDIEPAEAAERAVLILQAAFEQADAFMYDHGPVPPPPTAR